MEAHNTLEYFKSDLSNWTIGPFHSMLPGPFLLQTQLDGEVICHATVTTGFCFKGIEAAMESHSWQSQIIYADHLEPETAFFGELALTSAVEAILKSPLTPRMQGIRVILSELTRIVGHLGCLMRVAQACGAEAAMHYILRDREAFYDLFELLAGSRFSLNYLRYGGTASEMTDGFIERVFQVCDSHRIRLKEYNDVLTYSETFLRRTANVGVMTKEMALNFGVTGPNARASGVEFDVRKQYPYLGFDKMDFDICTGRGAVGTQGDVHDRVVVRLQEILQSIRILRQQMEVLDGKQGHDEKIRIPKDCRIPSGESYCRVESSRGLLGCHLISDGQPRPRRVQFRTPSQQAVRVIPELLQGAMVTDIPVILASLDLSLAETDK
jgi:NADH-quinone oxidoreductase subunit D